MWFFGAVFLAQFPSFAKDVLHGDEQVASLLLVVFSVGIGIGSLLCEVLSRRHVEIGLVPLGAIGMSVFAIDLYFASRGLPPSAGYTPRRASSPQHAALARDGRPGPAVAVRRPLQRADVRADPAALGAEPPGADHRRQQHPERAVHDRQLGRSSARCCSAGLTIPQVFLVIGLLNAVVAFYIFMLVPEYLLRFVAFVTARLVYRFKVRGDEHIPTEGAAILVCNHVSFIDPVLLMAASPRPIRFIMDHQIFAMPLLGWFFRLAKAIPIAPQKVDAADLRAGLRARPAGARRRRPALHLSRRRDHRATARWASSRAA